MSSSSATLRRKKISHPLASDALSEQADWRHPVCVPPDSAMVQRRSRLNPGLLSLRLMRSKVPGLHFAMGVYPAHRGCALSPVPENAPNRREFWPAGASKLPNERNN
jgi:hypothetical protein